MVLAIALACAIILGIVLAVAVLERPPPLQDQETLPQESGGRADECRYQVTQGPSAKSTHNQELMCDIFICKSTERCEDMTWMHSFN